MAANSTVDALGDASFQNVSGVNVTDAIDTFYDDEQTVTLVDQILEDTSDAFKVNLDELQYVVGFDDTARAEDHIAMAAEREAEQQAYEASEAVESGWLSSWISSFVEGISNRANERKGQRDGQWGAADNWDANGAAADNWNAD